MHLGERTATSELYASLLLMGVTLSFGGVVTAAALSQFDLSTGFGPTMAGSQQASAGKQISFVYSAVLVGSGSCSSTYRGVTEGKTYYIELFNYGSVGFTPTEVVNNSTIYTGAYPPVPSGGTATYSLSLSACAHPSGQTFLFVDSDGDEVQVGT